MVSALQELSNAPEGKYLNSLSCSICMFLLSYYKDDGNLYFVVLFFNFYLLVGVVNFSAILSYFQSASWIPFFNVCIFLFFHACADSFSYVLISRK
jgi:hypothetical protein